MKFFFFFFISGLRNIGSSSTYFQSQSSPLTTSYPQTAYTKQEEASSSQYSYEKALYVAANQYFLNKKVEASRGSRGGGSSQTMRGGRGRGGMKSGSSYYVRDCNYGFFALIKPTFSCKLSGLGVHTVRTLIGEANRCVLVPISCDQ